MTKKKPKKIIWASDIAVDALEPFVKEVLESVARITEQPGIASAWVSDESSIYDFMRTEKTGRQSKHPFHDDVMIDNVSADIPANHDLVRKIAEDLDVAVSMVDRVYEVAIRLRDR